MSGFDTGFPQPTFAHLPRQQEQLYGTVITVPCTAHVWGKHKGPIPLVAWTTPRFYYTCIHCSAELCTEIKIPITSAVKKPKCDHILESAIGLGPNYKAVKCTRRGCNYQKCEFVGN